MTAFYTYIAFSQYLLIWYANLPEETIWYRHAVAGSWLSISSGAAVHALHHSVLHAAVPARQAQPDDDRLMAVWSLVVEYIDLTGW